MINVVEPTEQFPIHQAKVKRCNRCGEEKTLPEFVQASVKRDGYSNLCKACRSAGDRARYTPEKGRAGYLKYTFGITHEDYLELLEEAGHRCQICGDTEGADKKRKGAVHLAIDHVHETGEIRGILCDRCNPGIGMLRDDPELLEKAAAYLRAFETERAVIEEPIHTWQQSWTSPRTGKTSMRWFSDTPEVTHRVFKSKRAALSASHLAITKRRSS